MNNKVIALIDSRVPASVVASLMREGFLPISVPPFSRLGEAVASHTDMVILRIGDTLVSYADYAEEAEEFFKLLRAVTRKKGYKLKFISDTAEKEYPRDAGLNALVMGDKIFSKLDTAPAVIRELAKGYSLRPIHTSQGYPACTVLKLNDSSAVTADRGMARTLSKAEIRVSLIENGGVSLPPYEHGFIGGASGRYGDTVYFIGKIEAHPSYNIIWEEAKECGLSLKSLGDGELLDLGGILFLE